MTWLFTQVWLWSLAAFALGSLITWLLFVRPLQRRLESVIAEPPGHEARSAVEDTRTDIEEAPLDLLDPPEPDRLGPAREPEPEFGNWDRPPRPWSARVPAEMPAEITQQVVPKGGDGDTVTAEVPVTVRSDDAETPSWFEKPDLEDVAPEWPQQADAGAEPEPEKPEKPEAEKPDAEKPEFGAPVSGQLRSLFEPLADESTPYVPPLGAEVTQNIPRVDDGEPQPLPRRTPGAAPRPGLPRKQESTDEASESRSDGEHAQADAVNSEAAPAAEEPAREGYMIKGHFASRQYHTPESPQYERIVAEVWFRTPADAEQAGFEPWDRREPGE
ncbi:hypothetical protein [Saccharopolyspora taberi]|uniref:Uncharacterized protein n=1 Tax=Saccharopolyspora taberi TaxID=60895 RepID=A0ABN3VJ74_9PSEU